VRTFVILDSGYVGQFMVPVKRRGRAARVRYLPLLESVEQGLLDGHCPLANNAQDFIGGAKG
jgi:hypothetical protein